MKRKAIARQESVTVPAPAHLSARTRELWATLVPSRARTPQRLALLQTALECLDRADAARLAVEAEGMTKTTAATGAVHVNPLVKVERENRQLFSRLWDQLGLSHDPHVREPR